MKYIENDFQEELVKAFVGKGWKNESDELDLVDKAFDERLLTLSLKKMYPSISEDEILEIFSNINSKLENDWFMNNKVGLLDLFGYGISTRRTKHEKKAPYKIIDLETPSNNYFTIHQEVWTASSSRQDVLLLVNGLPIFNFELKSFSRQSEKTTVGAAIEQVKTYGFDSPKSFTFNIASIALNQWSNSFVGSPSLHKKFWFKLVSGNDLNVFFDFFEFKNIKRYIQSGVLFGKSNTRKLKYILRHHQIEAVTASLESIHNEKGGYIWHTQGSGKTITVSALLASLPISGLASFTTIIDVDRTSLAKQIKTQLDSLDERHFSSTEIKLFKSSRELRDELTNANYRGVYITTTQKFNEYSLLTNRKDILFISDEAHRTHTDAAQLSDKTSYFENIQKSIPNAIKIGFTGTPIFSGQTKTFEMFGEELHRYTMRQAEEDNIITPISYSHIKTTLSLKKTGLLSDVNTEGQLSRSKVIDNAPERIKVITEEIGRIFMGKTNDFINEFGEKDDAFKAMFVVNSVESGFAFYKELKMWFKNHSKLGEKISNEIEFVVSKQDRFKRDNADLYKEISKIDNEKIISDFKKPNSKYKILIVKDMLLTGYDVKNLRLMFFDRYIHSHNLLQAIARVNRTFKNKDRGEIITFRDITAELKEALHVYNKGSVKEEATIDISQNTEEQIIININNVEKIIGEKLSDINQSISFKLNSIAIQYKNNTELIENLENIKSLLPLVYKWDKIEYKRSAYLAKMLLTSITREEQDAKIISITDEDFEKIINSIVVDKDIYLNVNNMSLSDLMDEKWMNKIASSELIKSKISRSINNTMGFSKVLKKSLIKKLKEIIFNYNNEVITIEELKINLEQINEKINSVNMKPQILQILISSIENVLSSESDIEELNDVEVVMEESFANDWWLTENSKKNSKAAIYKFLVDNKIADREKAKIITIDFLDRAIASALKYKGEINEIQ